MQSPTISVIMPVHNTAKYLNEAIDSVLNQTFTDFEFIIIDDGSTDGSKDIIKSYNDERIILIENESNKGIVFCLNHALSIANGQFIARMDSDDISNPNRLQIQYSFMVNNHEIVLLGSSYQILGSNDTKSFPTTHEDIEMALLIGNPFCHPTVIMRRSFLIKHSLTYNEKFEFAEDYFLWTEIIKLGKVANLSDILLSYRHHQFQIANQRSFLQTIIASKIRFQYFVFYFSKLSGFKFIEEYQSSISQIDELSNRLNYCIKILNSNIKFHSDIYAIVLNEIKNIQIAVFTEKDNYNFRSLIFILKKMPRVFLYNQLRIRFGFIYRVILYTFNDLLSVIKNRDETKLE
jgi:glycosyltransferase involved in cell wall biosynthesis